MFGGCSKLKFSTTQTDEYQYEYRIPETGTGAPNTGFTATQVAVGMIAGTGGTYTGDTYSTGVGTVSYVPINTTIYTANEVI